MAKSEDWDKIRPKRPFQIIIEIDSPTEEGLFEALEKCIKAVKNKSDVARCGGFYEHTNFWAEYNETSMNEEKFERQRLDSIEKSRCSKKLNSEIQ